MPDPEAVKFEILPDFHSPLIAPCELFLAKAGIDVAGVEFIVDKNGKTFVYDINTNTNYNSEAEQKVGFNAMNSLARYLAKELRLLDAGNQMKLAISG